MIAIIGVGKMGEALLSGLLRDGRSPEEVAAVERVTERGEQIAAQYGVPLLSLTEAAKNADTLLIAVKPQDMGTTLAEISGVVTSGQLVISVAAGITTGFVERSLGEDARIPVVRVMPNTPALVGEGMSVISPGAYAGSGHLEQAEELLRPAGEVVRLPESQQDAATALSGSGPAYVYLLAETLIDAGVLVGMPRQAARVLVTQTIYGAATMLRDSGEHPVLLREAVTSPGGTTAAAVAALESHGLRSAFAAAVEAARDRGRELGGA
jgi:pyrroline-5-carboxylate reductase